MDEVIAKRRGRPPKVRVEAAVIVEEPAVVSCETVVVCENVTAVADASSRQEYLERRIRDLRDAG